MDALLQWLLPAYILLSGLVVGYGSEASVKRGCVEHAVLEVGRQGMINCTLEPFYALSWYRKKDYDAVDGSPFIRLSNGEKRAQIDQYGVLPDGSLTFQNVTKKDEGNYTITVSPATNKSDEIYQVMVKVVNVSYTTSPPLPPADPVISGCYHQLDQCELKKGRTGELSCTVRNSPYPVELQWKNTSTVVFVQKRVSGPQKDSNLFQTSITTQFTVTDESVLSVSVECVATKAGSGIYLSNASASLQIDDTTSPPLPPADPIISGCYHQPDQCELKKGRTGELSCTVRNSPYPVELQWQNTSTVVFVQKRVSGPQKDSNLFQTSVTTQFTVTDESVLSVSVECVATKAGSGIYLSSASASLQIDDTTSPPLPPADPIISGCYHQPDQCELKKGRTGELSCTVRNSPYPVELQWQNTSTVVFVQKRVSGPQKDSNLFQTSVTTQFTVTDESVLSVSVECVATKAGSGIYLSSASASLQIDDTTSPPLPPADPIISGCYHQPDQCELKGGRTGELSCTVRNSPYPVELQWKNTSTVVFVQKRVSGPQKDSNLFQTSVTTQFTVTDESVLSVSVECVATKAGSGIYLPSASASLQIDAGDVGHNYILDAISKNMPSIITTIVVGFIVCRCMRFLVTKGFQSIQTSIAQVVRALITERGLPVMQDSRPNSDSQREDTSDRNERISGEGTGELVREVKVLTPETLKEEDTSSSEEIGLSEGVDINSVGNGQVSEEAEVKIEMETVTPKTASPMENEEDESSHGQTAKSKAGTTVTCSPDPAAKLESGLADIP